MEYFLAKTENTDKLYQTPQMAKYTQSTQKLLEQT